MDVKKDETYCVNVYIAGDIQLAKNAIRSLAYQRGMCVTVTPTSFIYTGGEEEGVIIGFVGYPRFPVKNSDLFWQAKDLVCSLLPVLNQRTALLVAPDKTEWISKDPPGRNK